MNPELILKRNDDYSGFPITFEKDDSGEWNLWFQGNHATFQFSIREAAQISQFINEHVFEYKEYGFTV